MGGTQSLFAFLRFDVRIRFSFRCRRYWKSHSGLRVPLVKGQTYGR